MVVFNKNVNVMIMTSGCVQQERKCNDHDIMSLSCTDREREGEKDGQNSGAPDFGTECEW
jgi:hypothetical protein